MVARKRRSHRPTGGGQRLKIPELRNLGWGADIATAAAASILLRHCEKRLGQSLMARDFNRQVAEHQFRVAVLNRHTALGTPVTEPVGLVHPK